MPWWPSGKLAAAADGTTNPVVAVAAKVRGRILDGASERILPARLYILDAAGRAYFPSVPSATGSAIKYQRRAGEPSEESHTTLSAHPFEITLPPGHYRAIAEHGKEWLPAEITFDAGTQPVEIQLRLQRFVNLAQRGWFSGDTHNHRNPKDLPNVQLAEDLNVALPMVSWTTVDTVAPGDSPQNFPGEFPATVQRIDATHAWFPRCTEYEIFNSAGRPHTQGALLVLNHRTLLNLPAHPIRAVVARARAEGALLDLEKHNWPWSMPLASVIRPDLFELANNHHWRSAFGVRGWALGAPPWMQAGAGNDTERNWTLFGFRTWYALLNCGFEPTPAAGTANGVHPVPLGFGRVYVHLPDGFEPNRWLEGLRRGRSFVTTGPLILAQVQGRDPGEHFQVRNGRAHTFRSSGELYSESSSVVVETVVNGEVVTTETLRMERLKTGGYHGRWSNQTRINRSGWLAMRAWETRADGRFRFAHTGAWHVRVGAEPVRPRRLEVAWFLARCQEELARNRGVLPPADVAEYEAAYEAWQTIAEQAVD